MEADHYIVHVQWRLNKGRCGVCGDPWDAPSPRPQEGGGAFGRGVIVRRSFFFFNKCVLEAAS